MNYKWNKLGVEMLKSLSSDEKADLLELIVLDLNGKKVNGKVNKNENIELTELVRSTIISPVVEKERFWQEGQWYLTVEDYNKLELKLSESQIEELIKKFRLWSNPNKLKRTNVYLTLNNWCNKSGMELNSEQNTFMEKSFDAYIRSTSKTQSSRLAYNKIVKQYFRDGFKIEDLREYWKLVIPKEVNRNREVQYRRKAETCIKEFREWMELRGD